MQIVPQSKTGIFLAQYMGQFPGGLMDAARAMAEIGYHNVQLPPDVFDLAAAADSALWCQDNVLGPLVEAGVGVSEISFHIPGQLIAVHPTYRAQYAQMLGMDSSTSLEQMYHWGVKGTRNVIRASANMGLKTAVGFTGSLLWPFMYPWPQRPSGLVEAGFTELAKRWQPLLELANECDVNLAFELHPGEDVHDGASFCQFHSALQEEGVSEDVRKRAGINYDPSHFVLQGLDYLCFIEDFAELIYAYHAKDAELGTDGVCGVYGGFLPWGQRAGKFRTPGTGDVDFFTIQQLLGDDIVAVVEWEDPKQDAMQGARWAYQLLVSGRVPDEEMVETNVAFDDFAASGASDEFNRMLLGLDQFTVTG